MYSLQKCKNMYIANIFDVIFTVFKCVWLSTVILLYGLHLQVTKFKYYNSLDPKDQSEIIVLSSTALACPA